MWCWNGTASQFNAQKQWMLRVKQAGFCPISLTLAQIVRFNRYMFRRVAIGLTLLLLPVLVLAAVLIGTRRPSSTRERFGIVVSNEGRQPGARVRCQGEATWTITDREGRFALPAAAARKKITAAKEGFLIAGAWSDDKPLRIDLRPLPTEDAEDYQWIDPTPSRSRSMACGNCHEEIHREWESSGHARAATNRHFLNMYDGSTSIAGKTAGWNLLKEHPDGAGVCASCHAPTFEPDAAGDYDLRRARKVDGLSGVHCDFCHKVAGPAGGELGLTHGRFGLRLLRPKEGQLFFGPLDDVDRGDDAWSPFQRDSRFCASCHEGVVFGVPVYTTYSEWRESPAAKAGKHCQDCHMKPTGRMTNIAPGKGGIDRDPSTLGNHRFFDESLPAMLKRSLQLDLDSKRHATGIGVQVTVRADDVGHRVPTGFVDRNLVLVVEAFRDDGGKVDASSGSRLPSDAGPNVAGQPGRLFAKQLRDFDGRSPAPFWRADSELIDTRLRPGVAEVSTFEFPPAAKQIRARLLYRRFWPEVAVAKGWVENEIEVLRREWRAP
jgi:nitrate/TMAO reductase-like tetraheme cytochrome c subunit